MQAHAVLVDGVEHRRVESARHGPAAEQRRLEPKPFLVSERDDVDRIIELPTPLVQPPKAGDGSITPKRAVVLPALRTVSRWEPRMSRRAPGRGPGKLPTTLPTAVHPRVHARLAHPPHDELRRPGVLRGQIAARELGGVFAALRELVEPLHDDGSEIHAFTLSLSRPGHSAACAPIRLATSQYVRFATQAAATTATNPIMPMNSGPPSVRNAMGMTRSRYAS